VVGEVVGAVERVEDLTGVVAGAEGDEFAGGDVMVESKWQR
jgi:hypothetical protein